MPQAVDNNAVELEQITARLRDLERRVTALEGNPESSVSAPSQQADSFSTALQRPKPPATWRGFPPVEMPTGAVPVLGKAVLGIAGAYLLRAIAEAGPIPKVPVLIAAIVYAALWMVWAVRTHDTNRFASAAYSITSVLILAPLLWESTVRFQVISPVFTAVVLVAFIVLALTLSWRRQLQVIPWVATLAVVITALALIIATHDLVPLTATMLAVAAITEIAACLEHRLSLRAVPAMAADFAIWLLVDVMTSAEVPEGYRPAGTLTVCILCLALVAIYGAGIGVRSFALRHRISVFEIVQGVLAFVLATFGILRATQGSAAWVLGIAFLLLSVAFYWGGLLYFADESCSRNRRVSSTWAAALLLAGTFLVFSVSFQLPFLCLAALAGAVLYSRTRKFSLGLHASFYLSAATAVSPLPAYIGNALAGSVPAAPGWNVWIVGITAVLCYLVGARVLEDRSQRRLLWVVPAVLAGFTSAAIIVVAISGFAAGRMELTPSRLSVIRTVVNCALALTLGFAGSRGKRVELGWVAYAAVAFGTLKLLLEDLRFGNAASLVVSLLCYGSVLILLPRLTRRAPTKS
jgi:hypothetical protein